jgi:hypothetical protein
MASHGTGLAWALLAAGTLASSVTDFIVVPPTLTAGQIVTATIPAASFYGGDDTGAIRAIEVFLAIGNSTEEVLQNSNATQSECKYPLTLSCVSVPAG